MKSRDGAAKFAMAMMAAVAVLLPIGASAIDLTFGDPTVVGDGSPGTTAYFTNVAVQDGVNIDMLAKVIDATPGKVAYFSGISGGRFRFDIGDNSGDRFFKVRYKFFESGTSTPRAIDAMAWSIGDLDETSSRIESVAVKGATSYIAETDTTLDINQTSRTISATGTVDLDQNDPDGNPEGVISFVFEDRTTLVITYAVQGGGGGYFDHDGDSEFPFFSPEVVNMGIYFTFNIVNEEDVPVKMDFTNTLPADFKWDTEYDPEFDEPLGDESDPGGVVTSMLDVLAFSGGDKTVSFTEVTVPPGTTTFTLKTVSTAATGEFTNEATVTPSENSGFPQIEMVSTSLIDIPEYGTIPPEGPVGTLVETFKTNFCIYAMFVMDGEAKKEGNATVAGDIGIASGVDLKIPASDIEGDIIEHDPPAVELDLQVAAAYGLAEDFAALPATQTFGLIDDDLTINATAGDGVNVIEVFQIVIKDDMELVLQGTSSDWFIINVADKFELKNQAKLVLSGVPPAQVIFNFDAEVSAVAMQDASAFPASVLAPGSQIKLEGSSHVIGSVITGGSVAEIKDDSKISGIAPFGGSCD